MRGPTGRPGAGEYAEYAGPDIDRVPGDDAVEALRAVAAETLALLTPVGEAAARGLTYAPGKWTLKEVVGHLAGLLAEAWLRRGIVNGYTASVRGLAFHIAGHELHHLPVLREKYLSRRAPP